MNIRIIVNDIRKSKAVTLTTMLFITVAAMLISLAAILMVHLSGSLNEMMKQAKTPHMMQMHSGEINMDRLLEFSNANQNVDEFQVLEFLNIDGADINLGENSMVNAVHDFGFSVQSNDFDFLLGLDGTILRVTNGEIYVPVGYWRDGTVNIGDLVTIAGMEFKVAGFLRDSQMNSSLSSSKRFLLSEEDYEKLRPLGTIEYLIEFRLKNISELGQFEMDYARADLEANGPVVTWHLFKTLNALSDGLMIAVILLISILVVIIAFLCVRFTLLGKIEEEYREIGVMKAIGLRVPDIKRLYRVKYIMISAVGAFLGLSLSFLIQEPFTTNIRMYMGDGGKADHAFMAGLLGGLFVFLSVILYVNRVLKRFQKISAVEAIRFGAAQEYSSGKRYLSLSNSRLQSVNTFLGVQDVVRRKKLYITMLLVLVLSSFIMLVPQNLYHTISSQGFIGHMGIGNCDVRIDIQQTEDILGKSETVAAMMEQDHDINNYVVLNTKSFKIKEESGSEENIKIELGNHRVFPVDYLKGRAPESSSDLALSMMLADELGKSIGDTLTIFIRSDEENIEERTLQICGLYSDITNGGKTAKAAFADHSSDVMWSVVCAEVSEPWVTSHKVEEYRQRFTFAKVSSIEEYMVQMFGSTIHAVKQASIVAGVIALLIMGLITLLFMNMLVSKDRHGIAILKALGFSNRDIRLQYIARSMVVLVLGVLLGTVLANTAGQSMASVLISSFGASVFRFEINPVYAYIINPLLIVITVFMTTLAGTWNTGSIKLSENIKE